MKLRRSAFSINGYPLPKLKLPKLPKTVIIGGRDWKIEYKKDKNDHESSAHMGKSLIKIRSDCPDYATEAFLHEIAESIMVERGYRFSSHDTNNYRFVMNHQEFESFIIDLRLALKGMLKI